jgi:hypothetical protein
MSHPIKYVKSSAVDRKISLLLLECLHSIYVLLLTEKNHLDQRCLTSSGSKGLFHIGEKMPRKSPTMAEKLASVLLELQRLRGDPIDREHAKLMSAAQVNSLFHFDHAAGYACDGKDNHPTGLTPLLIAEHREKTAKKDIPAIAKGKRVSAKHEKFRDKMLAKSGSDPQQSSKSKSKKSKFQNVHRPIQSRGFEKRKAT